MKINQTISTTLTILITILVSFLFIKHCTPPSTTPHKTPPTIVVNTEYIEINTIDTSYVPKWDTLIKTDSFYFPIDTLAILKDYYTKYVYTDTLFIDTFGYALIKDTITENKISSRIVTKNLKIPITTIEKTYYINKSEIFLGPSISTIQNIDINLMYKTTKNQAYLVGLGLDNNVNPTFKIGVLWKIK